MPKSKDKLPQQKMIFVFEHKKTEKQIEMWMTYDESEKWVKDHPKYFKTFTTNHGDAIRLGVQKPPSDFSKYVLGRIKSKVPGAQHIEKSRQITKEI